MAQLLHCPICPFTDPDEHTLNLHINHVHFAAEVDTNATATATATEPSTSPNTPDPENPYLPCPEPNCGEQVLWLSLRDHLDLHLAEEELETSSYDAQALSDIENEELDGARMGLERRMNDAGMLSRRSNSSRASSIGSDRPRSCRLGQKELGPYAYETRMPSPLRALLLAGGQKTTIQRITRSGTLERTTSISNELSNIIPFLATLLEADASVHRAWICHESVQYVTKLKGEGGFCGYRNLQMLFSYLIGVKWAGWRELRNRGVGGKDGRVPGVLELQDLIEEAWDRGFNAGDREATGGIRGTRKYIGTPEAEALLKSLGIPYHSQAFQDPHFSNDSAPNTSTPSARAYKQLFAFFESYYTTFPSEPGQPPRKITQTTLPPIYLQQPGHSLTVIGFEIRADGRKKLLVLDPGFRPSALLQKKMAARMTGGGSGGSSSGGEGRSSRGSDAASGKSSVVGSGSKRTADTIVTARGLVRKRNVSASSSGHSAMTTNESMSMQSHLRGSATGARSENDARIVEKKPASQGKGQDAQTSKLLDAYRRGRGKFMRFSEFEIVALEMAFIG